MPHFDDQAAQLNMRYSKDPDFAPPTRWTRHAVLRQQERVLHRSKRSGLRERQVEKKVIYRDGWVKNLVVTVVNEREKKVQHRSCKAQKRGVKRERRQQFAERQEVRQKIAAPQKPNKAERKAQTCFQQSRWQRMKRSGVNQRRLQSTPSGSVGAKRLLSLFC